MPDIKTQASHTSIDALLKQVGAVPDDVELTSIADMNKLLAEQESLVKRQQTALELGIDPNVPATGHEKGVVAERDLELVTTGSGEIQIAVYDVTVDYIIGSNPNPLTGDVGELKGRVTDADLAAAGVDKEFLLRVGSIVPAGYAKV